MWRRGGEQTIKQIIKRRRAEGEKKRGRRKA